MHDIPFFEPSASKTKLKASSYKLDYLHLSLISGAEDLEEQLKKSKT